MLKKITAMLKRLLGIVEPKRIPDSQWAEFWSNENWKN